MVGCNNEQLHVSIDTEAGILIYIPLSKKKLCARLTEGAGTIMLPSGPPQCDSEARKKIWIVPW